MNFLDSTIENLFKTKPDNTIVFFPNGIGRNGFIVPGIEKKREIQKNIKRFYIVVVFLLSPIMGVGLVMSLMFLENIWKLLAGLIWLSFFVGIVVATKRKFAGFVKGFQQSEDRISIFEWHSKMAQSQNFFFLVIFGLLSFLFCYSGIQIAANPQYMPSFFRPMGILAALFFGFGTITFCYMVLLKILKLFSK